MTRVWEDTHRQVTTNASKESAQMNSRSAIGWLRRGAPAALAAALALLITALAATPALALPDDFATEGEDASLSSNEAGKHADFETKFLISGSQTRWEAGDLPWAKARTIDTELPPGLVGNPSAFPTCPADVFIEQVVDLEQAFGEFLNGGLAHVCPADSQVGLISPGLFSLVGAGSGYKTPLYNLEAPGGDSDVVARLGFVGVFYPMFIDVKLDPKRDYALTASIVNVPSQASLLGSLNTLWGVPTDPSHDNDRFNWFEAILCEGAGACLAGPTPSGLDPTPFMDSPTSCGPASVWQSASSYQRPEGSFFSDSSLGDIAECEPVPFEPTLSLEPTTRSASAASGLEASLHIPQEGLTDPETLATSHLKEAKVTLPAGFSLNASAADGLGSCTPGQIGLDRAERQVIDLNGYGAPVSLSFGGQSTAVLPQLATAVQVQAALEALPNLSPGDVAVSGRVGGPWTVDFQGSLAGQDVPPIIGTHSELQRLLIKAKGGTYTLAFDGAETGPIPYNADPGEVSEALEALSSVEPGEVDVRGGRVESGFAIRVAFMAGLGQTDLAALQTTNALVGVEGPGPYPQSFAKVTELTDGGSAVETRTVKQGGSLGFNGADPACPDSSKVATGEIHTPVLGEPLKASFYLAKQSDNPFNSLFAGYLVAKGAGALIKVPARIDVDPQTGQVTTTFTNNPQQPFEDLELHFKGGNRGLITTPGQCGTYASTYELTPWSGNPPVKGQSEFTLDQNCGEKPFSPGFHAGSETALAGSFTTFATQVTNETGAPDLTRISVDLPEGLSAQLAGVATCPDAALAALPTGAGSGAGQINSPSCPVSSLIGRVEAGAGSGSPFYVKTGRVYLAGPYKGAPLSLAVITPAVAGPFDLGNVLVRVPVSLDQKTARAHAVSDPIPTMLQGIPLDLRDVRVLLDRQGFALNPTSCEPKSADGVIEGAGGASANVSDRFQVGECAALGFKPKLSFRLEGGIKRTDHPALTAVFRPRPGDANTARIQVALPKSEFLDQSHIGTVCTRVQFAADQCPKASIYGKVTATTPLLDSPLTGNVYLRSSDHELPDLVTDLRGPASQPIHLEAAGRIDSINGGIRTAFEFVPDAPITRVVLKMKGGRKGLLQNSRDICAHTFKAQASFAAHNGRTLVTQPRMQASCKGKRAGKGR